MKAALLIIVAVLFSNLAVANNSSDEHFSKAKRDFSNRFKSEGLQINDDEAATGDLNGDGVLDYAAFAENANTQALRMAIFLGTKDGHFEFYKLSSDTLRHMNITQSLDIKNKSLYLDRGNSNGTIAFGSETFQFSMFKGELMLIGIETKEEKRIAVDPHDDSLDTFEVSGISNNLLTNKKSHWHLKNELKVWKLPISTPKQELIKFEDFNYVDAPVN